MGVQKEYNEIQNESKDELLEEEVLPLSLLHTTEQPAPKFLQTQNIEPENQNKVIFLKSEKRTDGSKKLGNIRSPRAQEMNVQRCITMIKNCKNPGGWLLKALREEIKETLLDLQTHTKIPERYLTAMENDDYDSLPAFIYYKGFVSTYLRYLGVDEPDLVNKLGENFKNRIRVK